MSILKTEPTLITFIYGPINSGKTELMNVFIKNLHERYNVFYINLRGRFIRRDSDEFIKVLFDVEHEARYGRIKEFLNFFVRLTKELHVVHVFVITSDSLFIERVYREAVLHGRCR